MSDTPRTDNEAGYFDDSGCWRSRINGETVDSDFSRQLERELNDALHENGNLRQHIELLKYQIKVLSEEISAGP